MALSIKNKELEHTARELARLKGTSITNALLECAKKEVIKTRELLAVNPKNDLWERIQQIQREYAALPTTGSTLTDDEVLGYDEDGIPTQ